MIRPSLRDALAAAERGALTYRWGAWWDDSQRRRFAPGTICELIERGYLAAVPTDAGKRAMQAPLNRKWRR